VVELRVETHVNERSALVAYSRIVCGPPQNTLFTSAVKQKRRVHVKWLMLIYWLTCMHCVVDQNWSEWQVVHYCRSSDVEDAATFIAVDRFVCALGVCWRHKRFEHVVTFLDAVFKFFYLLAYILTVVVSVGAAVTQLQP